LHVQPPDAQVFVFPVHCELDVQLAHPLALHTSPAPHAGAELHSQTPEVHACALPPQSESEQQLDDGMHTLLHDLSPLGQPQPVAVHVWPARHAALPLQVQTPAAHVLLSPPQSASDMQLVQPDALHTIPPPHAAPPLQRQLPAWQLFVSLPQSELSQHSVMAMQTFPHWRSPTGQLTAGPSEAESWCSASGLVTVAPSPVAASDVAEIDVAQPKGASATSNPNETPAMCMALLRRPLTRSVVRKRLAPTGSRRQWASIRTTAHGWLGWRFMSLPWASRKEVHL